MEKELSALFPEEVKAFLFENEYKNNLAEINVYLKEQRYGPRNDDKKIQIFLEKYKENFVLL